MNLSWDDWKEIIGGFLVLCAWFGVVFFFLLVGPPVVGAGYPN